MGSLLQPNCNQDGLTYPKEEYFHRRNCHVHSETPLPFSIFEYIELYGCYSDVVCTTAMCGVGHMFRIQRVQRQPQKRAVVGWVLHWDHWGRRWVCEYWCPMHGPSTLFVQCNGCVASENRLVAILWGQTSTELLAVPGLLRLCYCLRYMSCSSFAGYQYWSLKVVFEVPMPKYNIQSKIFVQR